MADNRVVCCDTSFLISLYGNDSNTRAARAELGRLAEPISITRLNEFEFFNANRLAVFQQKRDVAAAALIALGFSNDLASGQLRTTLCDLAAVLAEASRLSVLWTLTDGHRAFDILHVAAARHLRAEVFLSFDIKQCKLAFHEGLTVRP